jgi:hypothetical protein
MEKRYLYLTGDLFVSENDDIDIDELLSKHFDDGYLVVNLEGSLSGGNASKIKAVPLAMNESVFRCIKGNRYFSIVNNHILDQGIDAFKKTLERLGHRGILSLSKEKDPRRIVGSLHLMYFADSKEECPVKKLDLLEFNIRTVEKYRKYIENTFVIIHGGLEYRKYPTPYQRELSRRIIDVGALGVVFHHSHVAGVCEKWRGKYINYGLGNLYFSKVCGLHGPENTDGMILRIDMETMKIQYSKVLYKKRNGGDKLELILDYSLAEKIVVNLPEEKYTSWYRKEFPLDSSFRPRQLEIDDNIVHIKDKLWRLVAAPLVYLGLSKKIKNILENIFKKRDMF